MGNNSSKKSQGVGKQNYFKAIYDQMLEDETVSFWDLVPIQNTLIGRTVSHVIFRSVGLSISQYIKEKIVTSSMPNITEITSMEDAAEMEFLSAWNVLYQSFSLLQKEALSFHALLEERDYQLWMAQSLSKIQSSQWEKQKTKFTQMSGNPAYIVAYMALRYSLQGRNVETLYGWLPKDLTYIEKYVVSRTLRGYELAGELTILIADLKNSAKKHGYTVMAHTQVRVQKVFNVIQVCKNGELCYGMTDEGKDYYDHASVLWGLWGLSMKAALLENETFEEAIPSFANSLVSSYDTDMFVRMRNSFLSEWTLKYQQELKEAADAKSETERETQLSTIQKELERVKRELNQANEKLSNTEKELKKKDDMCVLLETDKKELSKQNSELTCKLKAAEKKLAIVPKAEIQAKTSKSNKVDSMHELQQRMSELEKVVLGQAERLNDVYLLLSAKDSDCLEEDTCESTEGMDAVGTLFDEDVKNFTGRVILNGGARTWQERVRKWFESKGVKVRVYELGDSITGIKETDVVLMNVIQNKHKYSVKFMNDVRAVGAKLKVCTVNNLVQTLRVVFEYSDQKQC